MKGYIIVKLKKLIDYAFSLKFYAGAVATWLLYEGKIDGWIWLSVMGMVLASRQMQHLSLGRGNHGQYKAKNYTHSTDDDRGCEDG